MDWGRLGIMARDINKVDYELADDQTLTSRPQYRAGLSFDVTPGMVCDIDYDLTPNKLFDSEKEEQRLAAGLEMLFGDGQFRLRVGANKDVSETGSPLHYALGAGLIFGFLGLDTAASINQTDNIWNWSGMITIFF